MFEVLSTLSLKPLDNIGKTKNKNVHRFTHNLHGIKIMVVKGTGTVPALWKLSTIVPVPKRIHPKEMNDLRPVALTSVPMKCLERVISNTDLCRL